MAADGAMDPVDELLTEGLEHYLNGRLRDAATAWHEVLRLDPTNFRAREYLKSALSAQTPNRRETTSPHALEPASHQLPPTALPATQPPSVPGVPSIELTAGWDEQSGIGFDLVGEDPPPPPRPREPTGPVRTSLGSQIPSDPVEEETKVLLRGARELYALNDFSGALELLEKLLELAPAQSDALRLRDECTETLVHMHESRIGDRSGVPEVAVNPDEIIWLNLDHRAGFVLSQIDGWVSYDDLYSICGMSRLDTAKILADLLREKIIRTR